MATEAAAKMWVVIDRLSEQIETWSQKNDVSPAQMRMLAGETSFF